jgi:glycosyltransferase involved in cell wall biosynthesis
MSRIEILFLHSSSDLYGSDRALLNILSTLDRAKFEPHVILPDFGPLHSELNRLGIQPRVMNYGVLRRKLLHPFRFMAYVISSFCGCLRILSYAKRNKIRIIHSNTSAILTGGVVARLLRIPHIMHLREIVIQPKWLWRILSTFAFLFSDRVLAVSEAVKDHWLKGCLWRKPGKIDVLYDGIDTVCHSPEVSGKPFQKELGAKDGDILIGMIGRINRWKGQDYLVDVAREVILLDPRAIFVIVGDAFKGEEILVERLKERLASRELQGKVLLLGFRKDVPEIHSAFDIYVHPSTQPEPFGFVVAEAMSAGKPVVANNLGGVREIIVNGLTGFLVDPKEKTQMVEAIVNLARDRELRDRMGRAGRKRIIEKFSMDQFKEKMDFLWNSVNSK